MGRDGSRQPGVTLIQSKQKDYEPLRSETGGIYLVAVGSRSFMVVCGFGRTLVFERIAKPDCYVMRREVLTEMDPAGAVTGYVLGPRDLDPLTDLKIRLEREQHARFAALKELERLRASLKSGGGGGKRGRRNS